MRKYNNESSISIPNTMATLNLSSLERGCARFCQVRPSPRTSSVAIVLNPRPTHVLVRRHTATLAASGVASMLMNKKKYGMKVRNHKRLPTYRLSLAEVKKALTR